MIRFYTSKSIISFSVKIANQNVRIRFIPRQGGSYFRTDIPELIYAIERNEWFNNKFFKDESLSEDDVYAADVVNTDTLFEERKPEEPHDGVGRKPKKVLTDMPEITNYPDAVNFLVLKDVPKKYLRTKQSIKARAEFLGYSFSNLK